MGEKKAVAEGDATAVETWAEEAVAEKAAPADEKKERIEPVTCIQEYTEREFRREYPDICNALIAEAKSGNLPVIRLLLEIIRGRFSDAQAAEKPSGKSLGELLMDELKRRQDEREAAADAAKASDAGNEGAKSDGEAE